MSKIVKVLWWSFLYILAIRIRKASAIGCLVESYKREKAKKVAIMTCLFNRMRYRKQGRMSKKMSHF